MYFYLKESTKTEQLRKILGSEGFAKLDYFKLYYADYDTVVNVETGEDVELGIPKFLEKIRSDFFVYNEDLKEIEKLLEKEGKSIREEIIFLSNSIKELSKRIRKVNRLSMDSGNSSMMMEAVDSETMESFALNDHPLTNDEKNIKVVDFGEDILYLMRKLSNGDIITIKSLPSKRGEN